MISIFTRRARQTHAAIPAMRRPWGKERTRPIGLIFTRAGHEPYSLDNRLSYNGFRRDMESWNLTLSHVEMQFVIAKKAIIKAQSIPDQCELLIATRYTIN